VASRNGRAAGPFLDLEILERYGSVRDRELRRFHAIERERSFAVAAFTTGALGVLAVVGGRLFGNGKRTGSALAASVADVLIGLFLFSRAKRRAAGLLAELADRERVRIHSRGTSRAFAVKGNE
jgi:hypothetical protein